MTPARGAAHGSPRHGIQKLHPHGRGEMHQRRDPPGRQLLLEPGVRRSRSFDGRAATAASRASRVSVRSTATAMASSRSERDGWVSMPRIYRIRRRGTSLALATYLGERLWRAEKAHPPLGALWFVGLQMRT